MNSNKDLRKNNVFEILGIHLNTYDVFDMNKKAADVRVIYKINDELKRSTLKELDKEDIRKLFVEKEKEVRYSDELYTLVKDAYKELVALYSNNKSVKHFNELLISYIREQLIKKIDYTTDYYKVLDTTKNDFNYDKEDIFRTGIVKIKEVKESNLKNDQKVAKIDEIDMATFVLANKDIRYYYDNGVVRVIETENNKKIADEARVKAASMKRILPWVIIGGIVVFISAAIASKLDQDKRIFNNAKEKAALEESTGAVIDEEELVPDTALAFVDSDTLDVSSEENTEEFMENATEVDEEVVDINNEEKINEITENIYNEINSLPSNISKDYDKETIEALVRYARRYNPNYTGADLLNNEDAYENLYGLAYSKQFNIAKFYEDLSDYENINNVATALSNVKKDNSYQDEYSAYNAIGTAINNMDKNDYSEAVALRALVDAYIDDETMIIARNGAGVEEIDVYGNDVNYDKDIDGNVVDSEYKKAKIKYSSQDCKDVYDMVNLENRNAILTDLAYQALDDDKVRSR